MLPERYSSRRTFTRISDTKSANDCYWPVETNRAHGSAMALTASGHLGVLGSQGPGESAGFCISATSTRRSVDFFGNNRSFVRRRAGGDRGLLSWEIQIRT